LLAIARRLFRERERFPGCSTAVDRALIPDWCVVSVNDATGQIVLDLRAERDGNGDCRIYNITITATNESVSQSIATLEIQALASIRENRKVVMDMAKLVRLWQRPCKRGREFKYVLIWYDEQGKERWQSLGHADARRAERQLAQKERELRMGMDESEGIMLKQFLGDNLEKTRERVREGTMREYTTAIQQFIEVVGDVNLCNVRHEHGERFIQVCLRMGNRPATIKKKISALTSFFKQAVKRGYREENPFQHIRLPKIPKSEVNVFSEQECISMINAARESRIGKTFRWDLFFLTALCTGM
jgi:integrase-like protein